MKYGSYNNAFWDINAKEDLRTEKLNTEKNYR